MLFDINFQAIGIPPQECFDLANKEELRPGKRLKVVYAKHYSKEP